MEPAYRNVMPEDENFPDMIGHKSGEFPPVNIQQDKPATYSWAGDEEKTIQDSGTEGHHSYVMGASSGNSFPKIEDPHAENEAEEQGAEISEYGLNDSRVIGKDCVGSPSTIAQYGMDDGPAGGGVRVNITGVK